MLRGTGITPNMITVISIFVGAAVGFMFYHDNLTYNICGILLLVFANILDCVDGQLACAWNNLGILCLIDGDTQKAQHCFSLAAEQGSDDAAYNLAHFAELSCDW